MSEGALKAVYALYPDPDSAQLAVGSLRAAGVADRDIIVISSEPFEEYEFSHRDKATWMYWIAGLGGLLGLAAGTWLTSMTEKAWPLPTGGMPIVSLWPNLVVTFEITMLGAILATVTTLLITTKLPRRQPKLYDPEVSNGHILVGVEHPRRVPLAALERALVANGVARLKTIS